MSSGLRGVLVSEATVDSLTVLTMSGVLDGSTYRTVRDRVIKAALDEPDCVVVDVTGLSAPAESAWAVFTSARWHLTNWPEVPIALVCAHRDGQRTLARNGITRYVPVYDSLAAAAAADMPQTRRRVRQHLTAEDVGIDAARHFVEDWLTAWSREEFVPAAAVVVTALVDNALRHTGSAPAVRLESGGDTVTVAVQDSSTTLPARRENSGDRPRPTGLGMVSAVSRVWGMTPLPDGKVVWAVISAESRLS